MKNLKKLLALALSITMVLSFAACEADKDSSKEDSSSKTETTTTTTTTAEDSSSKDDSSSKAVAQKGSIKKGVFSNGVYSIKLGSDWTMNDSVSTENLAMFTYNDNEADNINIITQNLGSESVTVDDYKDAAISQFDSMDGYDVTNTENVKIDGKDACKVYLDVKSGSIKMKLIQCYIVNDSDVYVCTVTILEEDYEKLESSAEKILESFKIL